MNNYRQQWRNWIGRLSVALLIVTAPAGAADITWFGGTQRALPVSLASPKESGLRSNWAFTDGGANTWDFGIGTDISMAALAGETTWQSFGGRFGINSRFQYNSPSFDLWGADFRGGGVWGLTAGPMAYEVFVFHESAHLGDEVLDRQGRARLDYSVNGLRVMVSRQWTDYLRTYGGITGQPIADPDEVKSFGLHVGAEATQLPPWRRGFVALDTEWWEWRNWDPDLTGQIGVFLGPREEDRLLSNARMYVELRHGRVPLGQYYNVTEKYVAGGLALHW